MVGSTTLTIRLDLETKRRLEKLAAVLDVNLSDLLRQYVVPLTKTTLELETFETIRDLERIVLKALLSTQEFQEFLGRVAKYLKEEEFCGGLDCEYKYRFKVLPGSLPGLILTIIEKKINDKTILWPGFVEKYVEGMSTYFEKKEVKTLKDLADWLEDLEYTWSGFLRDKIEELRNAIRRLVG